MKVGVIDKNPKYLGYVQNLIAFLDLFDKSVGLVI